jgi:Lipase (class 3)
MQGGSSSSMPRGRLALLSRMIVPAVLLLATEGGVTEVVAVMPPALRPGRGADKSSPTVASSAASPSATTGNRWLDRLFEWVDERVAPYLLTTFVFCEPTSTSATAGVRDSKRHSISFRTVRVGFLMALWKRFIPPNVLPGSCRDVGVCQRACNHRGQCYADYTVTSSLLFDTSNDNNNECTCRPKVTTSLCGPNSLCIGDACECLPGYEQDWVSTQLVDGRGGGAVGDSAHACKPILVQSVSESLCGNNSNSDDSNYISSLAINTTSAVAGATTMESSSSSPAAAALSKDTTNATTAAMQTVVPCVPAGTLPSVQPPFSDEVLQLFKVAALYSDAILFLPQVHQLGFYRSTDQDAILIVEDRDANRCYVVFRGTKGDTVSGTFEDWWKNFDPSIQQLGPRNGTRGECNVRAGFARVFRGPPYFDEFVNRVDECIDSGRSLLFTGHSQGASAAVLSHLYFSDYHDVKTVAFAEAPVWTDVNVDDPCPLFPIQDKISFINTEARGVYQLLYDAVPLLDSGLLSAVAETGINFSGSGSILLAPEVGTNVKYLDLDIHRPTNLKSTAAHDMRRYLQKVAYLADNSKVARFDGFAPMAACHANDECADGNICVPRNWFSRNDFICCGSGSVRPNNSSSLDDEYCS